MKTNLKAGDTVVCINSEKFSDKEVGPPLTKGNNYVIKEVITTTGGNDHIDVGLKSMYNYVSCQATGIRIPRGEGDTLVSPIKI